ncbi:Na/Pi cotransporter family protein [Bacteroidota bacterium]
MLFIGDKLFAVNEAGEKIRWFFLIVGLLGGLALFLYGMEKMSDGMKKSAGNKMRTILATLTNNRLIGFAVGAFVTMVIQSSSATTVMLVSFVQAGLINFTQSIGVILGANVGTTFTAQLIAFKLTDYALLMVVAGFGMVTLIKNENTKHIGNAILGFGLLFFGMKLMSDAMYPLRSFPAFITALEGLENPLLSVCVGAVITALIQSSSALSGIVIVLAQQNLISLEAGIPLIIGANIGTCFTAGLASIGASREAKRVAIAHTLFNISGALLFVFWIPTFAKIVVYITSMFDVSVARQIANAHTIFNLGVGLFFIPFSGLFSKLILLILPVRKARQDTMLYVRHLDEKVLNIPEISIGLARSEIYRMTNNIGEMVESIIKPFLTREKLWDERFKDMSLIDGIIVRDQKIDFLQDEVVKYLLKVSRAELTESQSMESYGLISIAHDVKSMSDIIIAHIIPLLELRKTMETEFSEEGKAELIKFHSKMMKQINRLKKALDSLDPKLAFKIISKEGIYQNLENQFRSKHIDRIYKNYSDSVKTHQVHMEIMNLLMQINVYCGKIADTIFNTSPEKKVQSFIEGKTISN